MPYPVIGEMRVPYDSDGTTVGYRSDEGNGMNMATFFGLGVQYWMSGTNLTAFNGEGAGFFIGKVYVHYPTYGAWFFFPELRNITKVAVCYPTSWGGMATPSEFKIQGSADSTNGVDGTWVDATFTRPTTNLFDMDAWRDNVFNVTFPYPIKVLRHGARVGAWSETCGCKAIHLYGRKATGETLDDLLFCDATTGDELLAVKDFGDTPEASDYDYSFKVKNASVDKVANTITIQSNDPSLLLSWTQDPADFTDILNVASIAAGSMTPTIYVKLTIGLPMQNLGPKASRIRASAVSWS